MASAAIIAGSCMYLWNIARYPDWFFGTVGIFTKQIAVSNAVVKSMSAFPGRYNEKVHRIYNGIVLDQQNCDNEQPRAKLQVGHPKILRVRRLAREKNHELLLKAFSNYPTRTWFWWEMESCGTRSNSKFTP